MRILVTGGAGFIGSHVADRFLACGHEVAVVDDLSTGRHANVPARARFYHVDVTDREALEAAFRDFRPEVVDHHAAQIDVRVSTRDPALDARINVLGSLQVIEAGLGAGMRKLIFASSGGAIYGEGTPPVAEDRPERPISPYGVSKLAVEKYLFAYGQNRGLAFTALRYANVYGPRQSADGEAGVVAIFAGRLLRGEPCTIFGDGRQTRDYVCVADVAEANVLALEAGDGQALNIGTGVETSVLEIYTQLCRTTGVPPQPRHAPARPGEVARISLDASRAAEALGWRARVALREGLGDTVADLRRRLRDR